MDVKKSIATIKKAKQAIPIINTPEDVLTPGEIISERTANAKVFRTANPGERKAKVYGFPIHWKDTDGKFKTPDFRVKRKPLADAMQTHQYEVKSGTYHAHFKADKPYDYRLEIGDSFIEYKALFDESDSLTVQTETLRNGVKETITLNDNNAPTTLSWKVTRSGTGISTPPPTAKDVNGENISVSVSQKKDILTYDVDVTNAVFPIEVDPTSSIEATNDGDITSSAATYSDSRNASTGTTNSSLLRFGQRNITDSTFIVFRFFSSLVIPDMNEIISASFVAYGYGDESGGLDFNCYLFESTYTDPLTGGDFDLFDGWESSGTYTGTVLNDAWSTSSWSATWNTITINAAGLSAIFAKKNDTLKLTGISSEDYNASPEPAYNVNNYVGFWSHTEDGKEPYLSITYTIYRNMTGQADIAISSDSALYAERNMTARASVIFDAPCLLSRTFDMTAQADIIFDALCLLSRTFDAPGGQADIVFDASATAGLIQVMAGQADIAISSNSSIYAERNMTGQADMSFDSLLAMFAERNMTAQADIVFSAALLMFADRAMSAEAAIKLSTYIFMGIDGDSGLVTRY